MNPKHLEVMKGIENGATVWSYVDAKLLREIQVYDDKLLVIIDDLEELAQIEGKTYDGAKQLPYFGAILTEKGKQALLDLKV